MPVLYVQNLQNVAYTKSRNTAQLQISITSGIFEVNTKVNPFMTAEEMQFLKFGCILILSKVAQILNVRLPNLGDVLPQPYATHSLLIFILFTFDRSEYFHGTI